MDKRKNNVYVFDVPVTANKNQIIQAIETQFDVTITSIKTLVQTGKALRANRGNEANQESLCAKTVKRHT